jgi:hypothetical protein
LRRCLNPLRFKNHTEITMNDETISVLAISGSVLRHASFDCMIKSLEPLRLEAKARKGVSLRSSGSGR